MPHETAKKALTRLREATGGDVLPDLPGPDPLYSLLAPNLRLKLALMAYNLLENTEQKLPFTDIEGWGPRLYGREEAETRQPIKPTRKTSKANKATKMAWDILTKGRKTKLTKSACQKLLKKCSMISSKANPNTKSKIGKAKNGTTRACKKIRKAIWGTTKRN